MTISRTFFLLVAFLLSAPVRSAELGTVELATSCNVEANVTFNEASRCSIT